MQGFSKQRRVQVKNLRSPTLKNKRLLSATILAGSFLDILLTQKGLSAGYLTEGNPLLDTAMRVWPIEAVWAIKMLFAFLFAGLLSFYDVPQWVWKAGIALAVFFILVMALHIGVMTTAGTAVAWR